MSCISNIRGPDEWQNVLRELPLGKAAGPSKITNEMLKHLSEKMGHKYQIAKSAHLWEINIGLRNLALCTSTWQSNGSN